MNVFAYGSLMFDPVWSRIVSNSYDREEGILTGYDRKSVRGEVYPVIIPSSPHSQVQGIIYHKVSSSDLARLDLFEGEYYDRRKEEVVTLDATMVSADVYVLKPEYYWIISSKAWDPIQFSNKDIYHFIQHYKFPENDTKQ